MPTKFSSEAKKFKTPEEITKKKGKQPLPAEDVIHEDSGPSVTESEKPQKPIDVDDASIDDPTDDAFKK